MATSIRYGAGGAIVFWISNALLTSLLGDELSVGLLMLKLIVLPVTGAGAVVVTAYVSNAHTSERAIAIAMGLGIWILGGPAILLSKSIILGQWTLPNAAEIKWVGIYVLLFPVMAPVMTWSLAILDGSIGAVVCVSFVLAGLGISGLKWARVLG
jgi:hypothetical protein